MGRSCSRGGWDGVDLVANPTASTSSTIDGVWLVPFRSGRVVTDEHVWIGATSPSLNAEVSRDEYRIFDRPEELSQDGVLHLDRGSVEDGLLMSRNGQTAAVWMARLQNLVQEQGTYSHISLSCPAWQTFKVRIHDLSKAVTIAGGRAYRVSFSFREVTSFRVT